jgi:quercetin dioxygenase-like cupin family protein
MNDMNAKNQTFIKTSNQKWEAVAPGISRKIAGYNDDLMMVLVRFDEGGIGKPHSHIHTQTTYVESGSFEVTIAGKTELLVEGDSFFVPPNAVHGVVCKSAGVLIDVFNPIREDFL